MNPAIENLKTNQKQLDADGCMVGVSRQALDETLTLFDNLVAMLEKCAERLEESDGYYTGQKDHEVGSEARAVIATAS